MAYSIKHGRGSAQISGFLVSLPFEFDNQSNMVLMPDNAMATVQLALASARDAAYPNYSSQLAGTDRFELKDENDNVRVTLADFVPVAILASQSTDFGASVWLMGGTRSQNCKIEFAGLESSFPNFMKAGHDHYLWGGELNNDADGTLLKLSHADILLDATQRCTSRLLAMGPSGFESTNSIVNWVTGQGSWMISNQVGEAERKGLSCLKAMTIKDQRRGTNLKFFGGDALGKAQVVEKGKGAVFLLQGTCSQLAPDALAEIVRLGSTGATGLRALAAGRELRVLPQSCSDTTKKCGEDAASGDNTVFEGIAAWDLAPRKNGDEFDPATPILL